MPAARWLCATTRISSIRLGIYLFLIAWFSILFVIMMFFSNSPGNNNGQTIGLGFFQRGASSSSSDSAVKELAYISAKLGELERVVHGMRESNIHQPDLSQLQAELRNLNLNLRSHGHATPPHTHETPAPPSISQNQNSKSVPNENVIPENLHIQHHEEGGSNDAAASSSSSVFSSSSSHSSNPGELKRQILLRHIRMKATELGYLTPPSSAPGQARLLEPLQRSLLADVSLLAELDDDLHNDLHNNDSRRAQLEALAHHVRDQFHRVQNPARCRSARKLVCNFNKGCGFGCQMHHLLYCALIAFASNRTLILESHRWRYAQSRGWQIAFLNISATCIDSSGASHAPYNDRRRSLAQVIHMPIIDMIREKPAATPQAIPAHLFERLRRLHSDPFPWFAGQILRQLVRPNARLRRVLEQTARRYGMPVRGVASELPPLTRTHARTPTRTHLRTHSHHNASHSPLLVGVYVRRTDKVGSEAAFHALHEYMRHVERFFRLEELRRAKAAQLRVLSRAPFSRVDAALANAAATQNGRDKEGALQPVRLARQILLATDEPALFQEMRRAYPEYAVLGDAERSQSADTQRRYESASLDAVIIDVLLLSNTDYLVCTFSSQICRVAYELMQTRPLDRPDALPSDMGNRFHSLDDIYYYGGQLENQMLVLEPHPAPPPSSFPLGGSSSSSPSGGEPAGQLEVRPGQLLHIMGNHWNGWSKVHDPATYRAGLVPSFKLHFHRRTVNTSAYFL